ncbi:ELL2 factor, partial [Sakesphorus luctuosus]|nr:ELL2 factor [Sakesphorus luctuosus]
EARTPAQGSADPLPGRQRTSPLNPANIIRRIFSGVSRRPFKDRVIHLLALKDYKKPELLAHLQRDGVKQKDRDSLGTILQQVRSWTKLNPKDNSCSLKEHLFKDIQKDCPGYSEIDRRTLEIILPRNAAPSANATSTSHLPSLGPSDAGAPSR